MRYQFVTDHLKIFGAIEVPKQRYHKLLEAALIGDGDFAALGIDRPVSGAEALARLAVAEPEAKGRNTSGRGGRQQS